MRLPTLALALLFTGMAAQAQSWVLYDDFASGLINPKRWSGEEGRVYGGIRAEARRAVVAGQLRIEAKSYSDNYADAGSSTTRNSLLFAKPSGIRALRSSVTLRAVTASGCAANPTPTFARARLFGFFFNAGQPAAGSNFNDVYAGIQVSRASNSSDPTGVFRVSAFIGKCTDDSCIGSASLAFQDLGTATLGTPVDLSLSWDQANHRFGFQRAADTPIYLSYAVADTEAASFPTKRLEVSNQVAQCTATRAAASTAVDFDNVQISAAASPLKAQAEANTASDLASPDVDIHAGSVQ